MKIGSSTTTEGVEKLLNEYFYSTSYTFKEGIVSNSQGVCKNIEVTKKKNRFYINLYNYKEQHILHNK